MKLRLRWKWLVFFVFLLLLLLMIQGFLLYAVKKSFLLSSLVSLIIVIPLAYFLARSLSQPILEMIQGAIQLVPGIFDRQAHIDSGDELRSLSKAIGEMGIQLKNTIEEISKEKDYLQTILRGMKEGVLVVDGRSHILMVNDALKDLLSLSSDVADKMPLEIIRNAELEAAIRKAVHEGESSGLELDATASQGRILEVNVVGILPSSKWIGEEAEEGRGAVAVFHDITRLKELEKIRRDFVANVSHELRTPLTTIKGYAETLLEGALEEEVAAQFVRVIKRHSDRLEKIVEDLLILSKIESKEFQLRIESLSVSDLIADAIDFLKEPLSKKKISISVLEISPTPLIYGDRQYLEQVLINILDNAIKYGCDGGNIKILVSENPDDKIQVSVEDDGIGIPKEDLPRIFERFYRVDKGRSKELGGTGLGLSIVKHIVQAHGGNVWAESEITKGSTFYFTLPKRSVS